MNLSELFLGSSAIARLTVIAAALTALTACNDFGVPPQPIEPCTTCRFGDFTRGALFSEPLYLSRPMAFTDNSLLLSGEDDIINQVAAGSQSARATLEYIDDKMSVEECGAFDLSADVKWDAPLECTDVVLNPDGSRFVVALGKRDINEDRRYYYVVYGIDRDGRQRWRRTMISEAGTISGFSIHADQQGGVTFFARWLSTRPNYNELFAGHLDAAGNETRISSLPNEVFYAAIKKASDGTMIILGAFSNTIAFRGVAPLQATGTDALFLAALKPDGTAAWAHKIESTDGSLEYQGLSVFDDGRIMFAGTYKGTTLTLGEGQITGGKAYIAMLNAQGQLTWSLSAAKLPRFVGFVPTATGFFAAGSANVTAADGPMMFGGTQISSTDGDEAVLVHFLSGVVSSLKQIGGRGNHYTDSVARAPTGEIFIGLVAKSVGNLESDQPTLLVNGTVLTGAGTFVGEITQ